MDPGHARGDRHRRAVQVIFGSPTGLTAEGNQLWQDRSGIADDAETDDWFGGDLVRVR